MHPSVEFDALQRLLGTWCSVREAQLSVPSVSILSSVPIFRGSRILDATPRIHLGSSLETQDPGSRIPHPAPRTPITAPQDPGPRIWHPGSWILGLRILVSVFKQLARPFVTHPPPTSSREGAVKV